LRRKPAIPEREQADYFQPKNDTMPRLIYKLFSAIAFSGFLLIFLSVAAQEPQPPTAPAARMSPNRVMIINESEQVQQIRIGPDNNSLVQHDIQPRQSWVSPPYSHRPCIRIYTDDRYEEYLLAQGKRYRLYWDANKKCWDIKAIRKK